MVVKLALDKLGIHHGIVGLGEVEILEDINNEQHEQLKTTLLKAGLELMDDKKAILIEKTKSLIVEMIHYADELPENKSIYIRNKLNVDYHYLSALFAEVTGITIEQYIIAHKIERVKELLIYEDLKLTEIADKMNYSSVAHLSNQFKKVTGLTPTFFKQIGHKKRSALENV